MAALTEAGKQIRDWVIGAPLQGELDRDIRSAYRQLCDENGGGEVAVAVRSSATAEDLPDASFAGQQETFLNVTGEDDVVVKVKEVFASLYNDRAIAYRVHHGFKHEDVFLSAGVQLMVRSDVGASGVLFTLDTESGFREVVFITSSFGLGEMVVQGAVNPDEFYVYKPTLAQGKHAILRRSIGAKQLRMVYSDQPGERVRTEDTPAGMRGTFSISDDDVHELARQALIIEKHYGRPSPTAVAVPATRRSSPVSWGFPRWSARATRWRRSRKARSSLSAARKVTPATSTTAPCPSSATSRIWTRCPRPR